jgi:hypothetical protein
MKAFEFDSRLGKNEIPLPADLASQIPEGSEVRVILLLRSSEDDAWIQQSLNFFATGLRGRRQHLREPDR